MIDDVTHLNVSFDLNPLGPDIRDRVAIELDLKPDELHVFRRLTAKESKLLRGLMDDAEAEAWALIVGYR